MNATFEMLYTKNHRAYFNENHSTTYKTIQATSEYQIVQNYSRQTNMYELHCQAINRKCVLDRHISITTVVVNGSVGQYLT